MNSLGHLSTAAIAGSEPGRLRSLSEGWLQQVPEVITLPGEIPPSENVLEVQLPLLPF